VLGEAPAQAEHFSATREARILTRKPPAAGDIERDAVPGMLA
jgi:hypothetical protein